MDKKTVEHLAYYLISDIDNLFDVCCEQGQQLREETRASFKEDVGREISDSEIEAIVSHPRVREFLIEHAKGLFQHLSYMNEKEEDHHDDHDE